MLVKCITCGFALGFEERINECKWLTDYYINVLEKKDRTVLLDFIPKFKEEPFIFHYEIDEGFYWYEDEQLQYGILSISKSNIDDDKFIYIQEFPFTISRIEQIDEDYYKIIIDKENIQKSTGDEIALWGGNLSKIINKEIKTLFFRFDGDYLYIYLDDNKTLFTTYYAYSNEEYLAIKEFIKTNNFDMKKISLPRHADGTCDYEDVSSIKTVSSPTTNVVPNKTMIVSENLKLRSAEATTSEVLTVMSAGTKVKILELGKAENIDGINSNWVKVEVQSGAKDREGNTISRCTVGWCYGGYLAETTEANNFESTDTKEISDIKIEEAPKQEINIGIVCAIIGAVLLLLLVILIFAVRKKKDNP